MTDDKHDHHVASRVFNIMVLVIGGVGLVWMLNEVGWAFLTDAIESVGWWFLLVLALDVAALCCDAAALQAFMRPEARMVSYWRVLGAQISGRAINVLTPTGALGEPTKLAMLVAYAPRDRVLSSLVLQNLTQLYLSVFVILIGTPIMFWLVDVPHPVKVLVSIGLAVVLPIVIGLAILIRRGAVSTLVGLVRATRLISAARAARWRERMAGVDRHIRELQRMRSEGTWRGIAWSIASKCIGGISMVLLLYTAGIEINGVLLIGMSSVGVLIQWVANIVPMGIGVADGGNYALFDLVGGGGGPGLAITFLNRARSVSIAIVGLVVMAAMHGSQRWTAARIHRRLQH